MRSRLGQALCLGALLLSPFLFQAAQAAPPAEAFGSLPEISLMRLSPDGSKIAAIQPIDGRPAIIIYNFDPSGVKRYRFSVDDGIAEHVRWASNDRLIVVFQQNTQIRYDTDVHNWQRAFSINAQAGDPVRLMTKGKVGNYNFSTGDAVDMAMDDPQHVYMEAIEVRVTGDMDTRFDRIKQLLNVYRVDLRDGSSEPAEMGLNETTQWIMDGHGHAVARVDQSKDLKDSLMLGGSGSWHPVLQYDASGGNEMCVCGLLQDGNALGILRPGPQGKDVLYRFDLATAAYGPVLASNDKHDVDGVIEDEWLGRIVGVHFAGSDPEYQYFDAVRSQIQGQLQSALPNQTVSIESADMAGDAFVIKSSGPQQPPLYQLFKPVTSQLTTLASAYPHLSPSALGEMKPYDYKSRDGLDIHAYLTLPHGLTPHNLPAVVFPHGGPEGRDTLNFDWWAQFMASRGYAVLQPNFRGSSGYGQAFRDASNGQWGRKMQDDITDGVQKLIADGIVNPKRICIVGASYGGYAALAGATFTPDLYACAVSYAGISDLPAMLGNAVKNYGEKSDVVSYWQTRIGDRFTDESQLEAASPARHVDKVHIPILLIHSDKDVTVPILQSQIEADALKAAGKPVQFVTLQGDDHYIELAQTRIELLKQIETFLAANIGN